MSSGRRFMHMDVDHNHDDDDNDGDDYDETEALGLVDNGIGGRSAVRRPARRARDSNSCLPKCVAFTFLSLTCAAIGFIVGDNKEQVGQALNIPSQPNAAQNKVLSSQELKDTFKCPSMDETPSDGENYDDDVFTWDYLANGTQPEMDDLQTFKDTFRDHVFDGRVKTYAAFKEEVRLFKKQYFAPYLKSGDVIYESACGIGLNLLATLEILEEEEGITGITVYGNEYIAFNAQRANTVLDFMFKDAGNGNEVGQICPGDSSNLPFVPDNAFDLVYTGYVSPLWDPLQFDKDFEQNYKLLKAMCKLVAAKDDPDTDDYFDALEGGNDDAIQTALSTVEAKKLLSIMQERQAEWVNRWVVEMIRIAKPGAPVIIELLAPPYCQKKHDWGGVDSDFWETGVEKYGWDVVPGSITRVDPEHATRYNIVMLKNA